MTKKWLILITVMMLAGVLVSGCADNAEETVVEEETVTEDVGEEAPVGEGTDYGVMIDYNGMIKPSEIEINRGDTIAWRSRKPQEPYYTLVSDEGLFENQTIGVHDVYTYTFMNSGTYTFSLQDLPDMTFTVTVR